MILAYKVTLLVLKLLNESYIFSAAFVINVWSTFFLFLKTGFITPDEMVSVTKMESKYSRVSQSHAFKHWLSCHTELIDSAAWWLTVAALGRIAKLFLLYFRNRVWRSVAFEVCCLLDLWQQRLRWCLLLQLLLRNWKPADRLVRGFRKGQVQVGGSLSDARFSSFCGLAPPRFASKLAPATITSDPRQVQQLAIFRTRWNHSCPSLSFSTMTKAFKSRQGFLVTRINVMMEKPKKNLHPSLKHSVWKYVPRKNKATGWMR